MALHLFLFLLVVCFILSSSAVLASLLAPSSVFPLTRWGQARHAPPSAEAPLTRRLPRLPPLRRPLVRRGTCAYGSHVPGVR